MRFFLIIPIAFNFRNDTGAREIHVVMFITKRNVANCCKHICKPLIVFEKTTF